MLFWYNIFYANEVFLNGLRENCYCAKRSPMLNKKNTGSR